MPKRRIFSLLILILSMAGILLSYALAEEFYFHDLPQYDGHHAGIFTAIGNQVCGEADSFYSCESVAKSRFAVLMGFPLALYGITFYLVTFFMALACLFGRETIRQSMSVTLFWASVWGVLVNIGLFYISFVKIKALCPLCLFTYAVNFLLFGVALFQLIKFRLNPMRPLTLFKTDDGPMNKLSLAASAGLLCLMIIAGGGVSFGSHLYMIQSRIDYIATHKENEVQKIVAEFVARQPEQLQLPALAVYGNADAPVTIVEVSDFLCPYCSRTALLIDEIIKENPDTISVLFVNFPLDKACNHRMRVDMHKGACEVAKGAICAAAQGMLHPYQSVAFAVPKNNPNHEDVNMIAAQAGLDLAALNQCLEAPSTERTIQWQIEAVQAHGINATPTIFINAKRYKGRMYKEALQQIIDLEVKKVEDARSIRKDEG